MWWVNPSGESGTIAKDCNENTVDSKFGKLAQDGCQRSPLLSHMSGYYPFHIKFIITFFMSLRSLGWELGRTVASKMDCPWVILAISLLFISDEGQFYCPTVSHPNLPDKIRPTNIRRSQIGHEDFLTGTDVFRDYRLTAKHRGLLKNRGLC